jgi:hypothetical protein
MSEEIVKEEEQPKKVVKKTKAPVTPKEVKGRSVVTAKETKGKALASKTKEPKNEEVKVETPELPTVEEVKQEGPKVEVLPVTVSTEEVIQVEVKEFETTKPQVVVPDEEQMPLKLSKHAEGWRDWLAYQKITPADWLKRYPTHKMRHFVEEIIAFNAQNQA